MYTLQHKDFIVQYKLFRNNVYIVNSYKITKRMDMNDIVKLIRIDATEKGFEYQRSNRSWVIEWRAHNYMYDKRLERSRTGSVDLNDGECMLRRLCYWLISLFYRG